MKLHEIIVGAPSRRPETILTIVESGEKGEG